MIWSTIAVIAVALGMNNRKAGFMTAKPWAHVLLFLSGVKVEVRGRENLPPGGFLYLFNHTSHYDIPVLFEASPMYFYFGGKAELFSMPFLGWAMKALGALPIERANRNKVIQVYKDAEARAKAGDSFALAPEGTRQAGEGTLGPFKSGPFFFSVNASIPMVPIVSSGCEKVIPKHSILINTGQIIQKVIVEILPPTYPQGNSEEQIPALKDKIYADMSACVQKNWNELNR